MLRWRVRCLLPGQHPKQWLQNAPGIENSVGVHGRETRSRVDAGCIRSHAERMGEPRIVSDVRLDRSYQIRFATISYLFTLSKLSTPPPLSLFFLSFSSRSFQLFCPWTSSS